MIVDVRIQKPQHSRCVRPSAHNISTIILSPLNLRIERRRYELLCVIRMTQDILRPIDGRTPNDIDILFNDFLREQKTRGARPATIAGHIAAMLLFLKTVKEADLRNIQDRSVWVGFFTNIKERTRLIGRQMVRAEVKASTINTYRSRLGGFMDWLQMNRHVKENPIPSIKAPIVQYVDRRAFVESEIQQLFQTCEYDYHWVNDFVRIRNCTILHVLLHSGIRKGELLGLKIDDIDLENAILIVRAETSKSKIRREIPMNRRLLIALGDYLKARKNNDIHYTTSSLFVSSTKDKALSEHGLKHFVELLAKESGVHFHLHRFRHTFAAEMNRHGIPLTHLQQLLGHLDPKMTLKYGRNVSTDVLRNAVEKLGSDGYSR